MADTPRIERLELSVGGLSRPDLMSRLTSRGVLLNAHAKTLLEEAVFDKQTIRAVVVTERSVAGLGLPEGATLPEILEVAKEQGLLLCPADTGPYMRMADRAGDIPRFGHVLGECTDRRSYGRRRTAERGQRLSERLLPSRGGWPTLAARLSM